VIFGLSGFGKTTLARSLLAHHSRCLIVDPLREYSDVAVQVETIEELEAYLAHTHGRWRIAYASDQLNDAWTDPATGEDESEFTQLCRIAYLLGDCLFVIDEVDLFCSPQDIPRQFARLIRYGRHQRTQYLAIARRPSEVHRLVTSQAYEISCFAMAEPVDVDYLRKRVGSAFIDGLDHLPPFTYRYQDLLDRTRPMDDRALPAPAKEGKPAIGVVEAPAHVEGRGTSGSIRVP
jgi:hypothetical protein